MRTMSNGVVKFSAIFAVVISQTSCGGKAISEQDRKTLSEGCQALKANDKRSACMDVVGRLGQTTKPTPVAASKPEQPAREAIMLKGVPFDAPGSSEAVMNLCLSPARLYTADELKKSETWCKFSKNGRISMPSFDYGNISGGLSYATVDVEGSLIRFEASGSKGDMLELAQLLGEKYGKAVVTDTQTENKLGTKFDKKTFVWTDQRGTRITIESIYDKIDSGRIVIDSASMIKTIEAVQKLQKEVEKGKL